MTRHPQLAWKILTSAQWQELRDQGRFCGAPVDLADGYIHLSAEPQVAGTLDRYFAGQTGLYLAGVDLAALGDAVKWEESRGGALFPHLYADLPLSAVVRSGPLCRAPDGTITYPA